MKETEVIERSKYLTKWSMTYVNKIEIDLGALLQILYNTLFIFLAVCLEGKMHFYSIFPKFAFQGFHGNHFSHHF